jgi:acyl-CoA thioesterase FadM
MRAPPALLAAFPAEASTEVAMPDLEPLESSALPTLELDALFCFTDPLDHVNHTVHVDWCDGAIALALTKGGVPARELLPVAEEATFRAGIVVGERVRVETSLVGRAASGALAFSHRVFAGETLAATLTTVRTLAGADGAARMAKAFEV